MFDKKRTLIFVAVALIMFGLSILQFLIIETFLPFSVKMDDYLIALSIFTIFVGGMMINFFHD